MRTSVIMCILLAVVTSAVAADRHHSVGSFKIYSADSSSYIRLQLTAQMRATYTSVDKGSAADRSNTFDMKARRIRPTLSGQLLDPRLTFKLHFSMAPGSIELLDLYFNYAWRKNLQFRSGVFKVPFTDYRIGSFSRLALPDWAVVTKYFGAERQWGFALHNGYESMPRWGYVIGLFSGANSRASHAVGLPKLYQVKLVNPSDLSGDGTAQEFQPEAFAAVFYSSPEYGQATDVDETRGGFRYRVGVSAAYDFDPVRHVDMVSRVAPEAVVKYRGLAARAVGYLAWSEVGSHDCTEQTLTGWFGQAAYRWDKTFEVFWHFARVDLDDKLRDDVADFTETTTNKIITYEQEARLGLNIYLDRHAMKIQSDIGQVRKQYPNYDRKNFEFRSQVQLAF